MDQIDFSNSLELYVLRIWKSVDFEHNEKRHTNLHQIKCSIFFNMRKEFHSHSNNHFLDSSYDFFKFGHIMYSGNKPLQA